MSVLRMLYSVTLQPDAKFDLRPMKIIPGYLGCACVQKNLVPVPTAQDVGAWRYSFCRVPLITNIDRNRVRKREVSKPRSTNGMLITMVLQCTLSRRLARAAVNLCALDYTRASAEETIYDHQFSVPATSTNSSSGSATPGAAWAAGSIGVHLQYTELVVCLKHISQLKQGA